ncbi:murein hydrolase activator EnvC family protein [Brumicola pallidula]|jgi:septal ring factor EnvC (AmiA/AmiB activator)|uniref:Peptidase M23B n=1 Tax=Brumicola pallidula DSM 14239 = ACAM 615 TaxID=1121922 RepID=K6YB04_9ALTE|nr:peptidoglycan DD-metalloendopeptidase family protein [Glaciecola pallidula]GAC29924.1 peptidase M23B [Glaciecola pallidula DSM 14239 = ACAM 615]
MKLSVKKIVYDMGSYLLAAGLILFVPQAFAQDSDLATIQEKIKQTQAQLDNKLKSSERLQQELKLAELEIAKTATQLNQTDTSLKTTRSEKVELEGEKSRISSVIKDQQKQLAGQLKSAFMAGNYDFAKMFFNQDDAGRFERTLTYYNYLNKARQEEIGKFRALVLELEQLNIKLVDKTERLEGLLVTQKQQSSQLREQQTSRHQKLKQLDRQIKSDTVRVTQLQQEERSLMNAIEQAEIDAKNRLKDEDTMLVGLAPSKGKLTRPASGQIQQLFGKRRQGQVRWKGIVVNSSEGSPVRAVYDGKVLYADWLKGFGLVTIVDHGEGYMTVYGRNQALLKQPGDSVLQGETIGLVGSSGGQMSSGLYFEIRHKGKALNPKSWLQ